MFTGYSSVYSSHISCLFFSAVPAVWVTWTSWTACTVSCGSGGTHQRRRGFILGKNGARSEPESGQSRESQVCPDLPRCPGWINNSETKSNSELDNMDPRNPTRIPSSSKLIIGSL